MSNLTPLRKSSLSGANPVAPAESVVAAAGSAEPARTASEASPVVSPGTRTSRVTGQQTETLKAYPPKVWFYQDREDTARLRAAYRHTLANTSDRSLNDFIQRVVVAEVERLENQYNGGRPFPSVSRRRPPRSSHRSLTGVIAGMPVTIENPRHPDEKLSDR